MTLRLFLARLILGRPILLGSKNPPVAYEAWKPIEGTIFYYPYISYAFRKIRVENAIMDKRDATSYASGECPMMFATEEHALEASRRILTVLREYHEELGY